MEELERGSVRRTDGDGFGRPKINARALFDVIVLAVELDPPVSFHQIDELMPVDRFRLEGFVRFAPPYRAVHIVRPAQSVVENLNDLAMSGRSFFRKTVGVNECERHDCSPVLAPISGLHPDAPILALPAQVIVSAFQNRRLEAIGSLKLKIKQRLGGA